MNADALLGRRCCQPGRALAGTLWCIPAQGGPLHRAGTSVDVLSCAALLPTSPRVGAPRNGCCRGWVLPGMCASGDGWSQGWVLLRMGAARMGAPGDRCFQGWALPGMGAPKDRGPQSQLEGSVLLSHPRPCCGRHSGTPVWHWHQHQLVSSSRKGFANTSLSRSKSLCSHITRGVWLLPEGTFQLFQGKMVVSRGSVTLHGADSGVPVLRGHGGCRARQLARRRGVGAASLLAHLSVGVLALGGLR